MRCASLFIRMALSQKHSRQHWHVKQLLFALFIALPVTKAFAHRSFTSQKLMKQNNPSSIAFVSTKQFSNRNESRYNIGVTAKRNYNDKYHLIWSPQFWKKAAASTFLYKIIQLIALRNNFSSVGISSCHQSKIAAIVLPLLSSSCCAVQLIINALSGYGCAGFNTILGPIRPMLLPLLIISTWNLMPHRSFEWTTLSLFLAFLPELVYIFNSLKRIQQQQQTVSLQNVVTAKLQLQIPSMGCIACVNKIDSSIRQCDHSRLITKEKSWLADGPEKGGFAEVEMCAKDAEEVNELVQKVVTAVKDAGFDCSTKSLQLHEQ